tara:strand:- start:368 stop:529 length:162 start_codon:yes stop_codon:yes gene_type:complete
MGSSVVGTMSNFSSTGAAPDYEDLGDVTLDLAKGSYSYNAEDQCGSWSGMFTI